MPLFYMEDSMKIVRKLNASDIMACMRLLNQIGIKEDIKALAKESANVKDVWDKGFDAIFQIYEKAVSEENEQYTFGFISRFFDCDWKEIAAMDPVELLEQIKEIAEAEKWKSFFKSVSALMTK